MSTVLSFDELPVGSGVSLLGLDRGVFSGEAVPFSVAPTETQGVYVAKNGSDTTGNGSMFAPFLTIQRAFTSITDATTVKRYVVNVGPGTFIDSFAMIPWVTLRGSGRFATTLGPTQANWLGAAFAVAGSLEGSIESCTIGSALVIDFAAIVAVGTPAFLLRDLAFSAGAIVLTAIGSNVGCRIYIQQIERTSAASQTGTITLTDINSALNGVQGFATLAINGNDLYATQHRVGVGSFFSTSITSTATANANLLQVRFGANIQSGSTTVITGRFASVISSNQFTRFTVAPDADTEFGFGGSSIAPNIGALMLVSGAIVNQIFANPSAARVYSFGKPITPGTRVALKNQSAFPIGLVTIGAIGLTGDSSYVGPFGYWEAFYTGVDWMVQNDVQGGTTTLVAGVSPVIPADVSAQASIQGTLNTFIGAKGDIVAKAADRVVGTRAGGGSFRLTSIDPVTGATVVTDEGIYDWHIKRP